MHGALAGRVSSADDHDAAAAERRRFRRGGAVIHARPGVLGDARSRVLAIGHSRRGEHGPGDQLASVGERKLLVPTVDRDSRHLERHEELGAQPLRLRQGAARQIGAADAVREPQVVFDARARSGLSARAVPIQEKRAESFGRAVHSRGEAGGPCAHDHEVVNLGGGRQRTAETLGHLARLRVGQGASVLEDQGRQRVGRPRPPPRAASAPRRPARRRASDTE